MVAHDSSLSSCPHPLPSILLHNAASTSQADAVPVVTLTALNTAETSTAVRISTFVETASGFIERTQDAVLSTVQSRITAAATSADSQLAPMVPLALAMSTTQYLSPSTPVYRWARFHTYSNNNVSRTHAPPQPERLDHWSRIGRAPSTMTLRSSNRDEQPTCSFIFWSCFMNHIQCLHSTHRIPAAHSSIAFALCRLGGLTATTSSSSGGSTQATGVTVTRASCRAELPCWRCDGFVVNCAVACCCPHGLQANVDCDVNTRRPPPPPPPLVLPRVVYGMAPQIAVIARLFTRRGVGTESGTTVCSESWYTYSSTDTRYATFQFLVLLRDTTTAVRRCCRSSVVRWGTVHIVALCRICV
jgi:hypothetical protein